MKIKNKLTGFIAESAPDNWATSGYDTKTWEEYKEPTNKDGLTMEQANDSKYWKDGKYMGVDQTLPEFATGGNKTVYSSKGITDNIAATGSQIAKTEQDVLDGIDYNTELKNLINSAKTINDFTSSEIQDIEAAGANVGNVFNEEIRKAENAKTAGMGESTISGGRMGGFMNTQITGAGATNAGVGDWAGAGGKLESIKSAYDNNISDLQAKKTQAIELAKQARKEYIRTGKSTAMNAVQQALSAAQSINAQIIQNQTAKTNALTAASTEARTKKTYDTTEASSAISNMAQAGLDVASIPAETKSKYESLLGLPAGTFDKFYEDIKTATQFSQEGRYVDFTKKITDVLQTLPSGQSITINGKEYKGLGTKTGTQTASVQEYEYYKQQEELAGRTPMSYDAYQTSDANRKALASGIVSEYGLTPAKTTAFNQIVTKYSASPLIAASDRTIVLKNAAKQVKEDPQNGAKQLSLVYSYVQALDTYQSAVREGELDLVNSIDSKVGQLSNYVQQIQNGQIVRPDVIKNIADVADNLAKTIDEGAAQKQKMYKSQAEVNGISDAWNKFTSGFTTPENKVNGTSGTNTNSDSSLKGIFGF
jgi:hypothetical protein